MTDLADIALSQRDHETWEQKSDRIRTAASQPSAVDVAKVAAPLLEHQERRFSQTLEPRAKVCKVAVQDALALIAEARRQLEQERGE